MYRNDSLQLFSIKLVASTKKLYVFNIIVHIGASLFLFYLIDMIKIIFCTKLIEMIS